MDKENKVEKLEEVTIQDEALNDEISAEEVADDEIANEVVSEEISLEEVSAEETGIEDINMEDAAEAVEEVNTEEIAVEEISVEEVAVEEVSTEEASTEESSETVPAAQDVLKKEINWKKIGIVAGTAAAVLLAIYFGVAMYFSERFLPGTMMNGEKCTGKVVKDLETELQSTVENYVLTLEERGDISEQIKGTDIGIQYKNAGEIQKAMDEQNAFAWPIALFKKNDIRVDVKFVYDEAKLNEMIANLNCLKPENQEAPVSAIPVYVDGKYVIQEETYGNLIKTEEFTKAVIDSVNEMKQTFNLDEADCYVAPTYLKDSEQIVSLNDALNKCLLTNITYSLDSKEVTLDKTQVAGWLSIDANMNLVLSEEGVRAFADSLGATYNTQPRTQSITTPTGKVANISGATKGRIIGTAKEAERLLKDIKDGLVTKREPIITQHATPEGEFVWGTTYIEVDLSAQHMWYIQNGSVVFESDVVTGSPGRDTPAGVFEILTKKRNKTLVGAIVPSTGKPEYRTPVSYWARVTWSGIGFHDATWQPAFGGQLYKQGYGSHGCINMPLGAVKTFYEMISVGDPVVIHY